MCFCCSWTSGDFCHAVGTEESVPVNNFTIPINVQTPVHYFLSFFSDDLITIIVENTNLYSTQVTGKSVNTTHNEIKDFLAILLRMGIVDMPAYTDYWSEAMRFENVSSVMPLKRFQILRRYLHFANNDEMNDDSFYKVRPVLEMVRQNCIRLESENRHSIDEMMIPYKGTKAGSRRQYVKNKPKKWGYKMFVRSGVSGIVNDFLMYGGEDTFRGYSFTTEEEQLGMSGKVVVALCKSIQNLQCQIVYFDNFFCSLELILWLRDEYGIFSLGTLRANRLRGCPLKADKQLAKSGRGSYDQKVDDDKKIAIIKWYDNRAVVLASSYVASEPVTTIKRYSKAEKKRVEVCCPEIVKHYNAHMGGVDLSDMLVALYRTALKTRRWYMGIFSQILDICVNNAWLLYRRECALKNTPSDLNLKQFRLRVAEGLQLQGKIKRGRPSSQELGEQLPKKIRKPVTTRPGEDIRHDMVGHFPVFTSKGRCKLCVKGQTSVICRKCNQRLCFVEHRNCFLEFHFKK